jgi:hypothetical protein
VEDRRRGPAKLFLDRSMDGSQQLSTHQLVIIVKSVSRERCCNDSSMLELAR